MGAHQGLLASSTLESCSHMRPLTCLNVATPGGGTVGTGSHPCMSRYEPPTRYLHRHRVAQCVFTTATRLHCEEHLWRDCSLMSVCRQHRLERKELILLHTSAR